MRYKGVKGSYGQSYLKNSARNLTNSQRAEAKEFVKEFLRLNSPVDTGAYRDAWQVKMHRQGTNKPPIEVFNPLPYANRLEHGWSKQAPNGVARQLSKELHSFIRKFK